MIKPNQPTKKSSNSLDIDWSKFNKVKKKIKKQELQYNIENDEDDDDDSNNDINPDYFNLSKAEVEIELDKVEKVKFGSEYKRGKSGVIVERPPQEKIEISKAEKDQVKQVQAKIQAMTKAEKKK
ncbi:MAG: hypothetical protein AABY22_33640 [Nanoarchaeota archaeon]